MFSPNEMKSLAIAPMVTGPISLLSSGTLMYMMRKSSLKLSTSSRRLFFVLCFYDCVYSIGNGLSTVTMPAETGIFLASGNDATCTFQGALLMFGSSGTLLYNLSFSIYHLCVIVFSISDTKFGKKYEWILHSVNHLIIIFTTVFPLIANRYTSAGIVCWVKPSGSLLARLFGGGMIVIVFVLISISLILISAHVIRQNRKNKKWKMTEKAKLLRKKTAEKNDPHSFDLHAMRMKAKKSKITIASASAVNNIPMSSNNADLLSSSLGNMSCETGHQKIDTTEETCADCVGDEIQEEVPRGLRKSKRKSPNSRNMDREVQIQCLMYIGTFFICFIFPFIYRFLKGGNFVIVLLARIFTPLQGFLHVFVFSRPHVASLRRNNPEFSWVKAFWLTLCKGGDNNSSGLSSRASYVIVGDARKKYLARLERQHSARMKKIRESGLSFLPHRPRTKQAGSSNLGGSKISSNELDDDSLEFDALLNCEIGLTADGKEYELQPIVQKGDSSLESETSYV